MISSAQIEIHAHLPQIASLPTMTLRPLRVCFICPLSSNLVDSNPRTQLCKVPRVRARPGPEHLPRQCFHRPGQLGHLGHLGHLGTETSGRAAIPTMSCLQHFIQKFVHRSHGKVVRSDNGIPEAEGREARNKICRSEGGSLKNDSLKWSSLLWMKQKATKVRIVYFNGFGRFTALTLRGANFLGCQQWSREYHLWRRACASGHLRSVQSLRVVFPLRNTISICFDMFRYVLMSSRLTRASEPEMPGLDWGFTETPATRRTSWKASPNTNVWTEPHEMQCKHGMFILFECQA